MINYTLVASSDETATYTITSRDAYDLSDNRSLSTTITSGKPSPTAITNALGNITDHSPWTSSSNISNLPITYSDALVSMAFLWITVGVFGLLSNTLFILMTSSGSVRRESYAIYLLVLAVISVIFMIVQVVIGVATLVFHFSNISKT